MLNKQELEKLHQNMAEVAELKAQLKARCMIYHVELKETLAKFYRLPQDYFYHWEFEAFMKHAGYYHKIIDLMCEYREKMNEYFNLNSDCFNTVPFKYWMQSFMEFYSANKGIVLDEFRKIPKEIS